MRNKIFILMCVALVIIIIFSIILTKSVLNIYNEPIPTESSILPKEVAPIPSVSKPSKGDERMDKDIEYEPKIEGNKYLLL